MSTVFELLEAAAHGRTGVDRRFLRSILEQGDSVAAEALRFARAPQDEYPINLDPVLTDLFRHLGTPEALDFYIDVIRREPDEVDDSLVEALLPFGTKAAGPLVDLYEELGEEQGSDIGFLLAELRVRDPRVLELLLDRLEFDAADGAFCLGVYGDPAARPALEKMLAEVPESEAGLRREISFALEQLEAPAPASEPEAFDIFADYPECELPVFEVLSSAERIALFSSPDANVRAGASHSFFNQDLDRPARTALFKLAEEDAEPRVRGEAWAALADAASGDSPESTAVRDAMLAALNDEAAPVEVRGGAAVGLHAVADRNDVRKSLEALYARGGKARAKALEAMWRSLWQPYAKYFPENLDEPDPELARQALRGAGYFRLTACAPKIAEYFDREEPYDDLRDDALFAYALAMPGETTRGRSKGMLRKIDGIAALNHKETELVKFALDERLRLHGLEPVFEGEGSGMEEEESRDPSPPAKPGRNDPCPCGSGKKFKKCHGA